jgi:hypothetical protein
VLSDGDNDVKYPRHISPVEYLEGFFRISITIIKKYDYQWWWWWLHRRY